MILLTEKERQLLRESSSGVSPWALTRLKPSEKKERWAALDRCIQSIMVTHPEAFNEQSVNDMLEKERLSKAYNRHVKY
jgi:hypothetical protein